MGRRSRLPSSPFRKLLPSWLPLASHAERQAASEKPTVPPTSPSLWTMASQPIRRRHIDTMCASSAAFVNFDRHGGCSESTAGGVADQGPEEAANT